MARQVRKSSELLRAAKEKLPQERYVCVALSALKPLHRGEASKVIAIQKRIIKSIGCAFVTGWLNKRHNVSYAEMTADAMLKYRFRWIDWMAKGYERKGD